MELLDPNQEQSPMMYKEAQKILNQLSSEPKKREVDPKLTQSRKQVQMSRHSTLMKVMASAQRPTESSVESVHDSVKPIYCHSFGRKATAEESHAKMENSPIFLAEDTDEHKNDKPKKPKAMPQREVKTALEMTTSEPLLQTQ